MREDVEEQVRVGAIQVVSQVLQDCQDYVQAEEFRCVGVERRLLPVTEIEGYQDVTETVPCLLPEMSLDKQRKNYIIFTIKS